MKSNSLNPKNEQLSYSSKFDKESMDHQPHPVQKHFVNQKQSKGNNYSSEDLNDEQVQALYNQEQMSKSQLKQQLQQQMNHINLASANSSQQHQLQHLNQLQQQHNLNVQQQHQLMYKQQQYQQQSQQQQNQQQTYERRLQYQSSEYSSDDLQDDNQIEGIDDEHLYDHQQMAQFTNNLGANIQNNQSNNLSQGSNQNQNSNTNNSFSSVDEVIKSTDDTSIKEDLQEIDKLWQKQLIQDPDKYFEKIIEMNDISAQKLNDGQQKEALAILFKAEKMLEFAASCGKVIDRNLIIVVLYNRACAYQRIYQRIFNNSLWILDKCSKYIDGVIYNLEMSLREEDSVESVAELPVGDSTKLGQNQKNNIKKTQDRELLAYKIKKQSFLVKSYLQCCAILSQQGLHQKALETANEGANVLKKIFSQCYEYCKDIVKENEMHMTTNTMIKSPRQMFQNQLSSGQTANPLSSNSKNIGNAQHGQKNNQGGQKSQPYHFMQQNQNNYFSKENNLAGQQQSQTQDFSIDSMMSSRKSVQQAKEEVYFQKLVVEYAFNILQDIQNMVNVEDSDKSQIEHFRDARRSLYFWKNNPENNEKHIRQELNAPTKLNEEETRSILGVQNGSEWIESFNIGSIMHMVPVQYEEFSFFGDIMYEISKKMILEKVIYLSISYFTIATEIRFIEIERTKNVSAKNDQNKNADKNLDTEGFKKSQIYHLKSIEIVCQHITCKSPYINHLITSYHKHYNQNLETILEESFSSFQDNNLFDGLNHQQNPFSSNQNHQQYNILQKEDQMREGKQFEELVNKFVNGMNEDDHTPMYLQNNPNLSNSNNNIINNSLSNLQNSSLTKFNPINGQMLEGDDMILTNNDKPTTSPGAKQNNANQNNTNQNNNKNQKNQNTNSQKQPQTFQVNGSQSSRSQYSISAKNTENSKEKKTGNQKQSNQIPSSVLKNSALTKKNLKLDFNGSNLTSQSATTTNLNSQNLNQINRNLAEFFSHDNSKKNTPRGILNIRKSTPAVEQSSKEVALTEPNAPSSASQPRSMSKTAKKAKQSIQAAQLKKINKMSIEKVTQILKNNLLASYSQVFLSQNNLITLNHSKNPSSNLQIDKKKPQTSDSSSQQAITSSPNLKKKSTSGKKDQLRKSAIVGTQTQSTNEQQTNNSSNKTNGNNNSSSVPSTTQSSTKSKKQSSISNRQQANGQTLPNSQVQCNTDRQLKDSNLQQQKAARSDIKDTVEKKFQKSKADGIQTQNYTEGSSPEKRIKSASKTKENKTSNKKEKEQKISENRQILNSAISAQNFLSLKTIKKETIQQLLKESKKIPKLNLNQLKIKSDEIRFYSPREQPTSTISTSNKQQV